MSKGPKRRRSRLLALEPRVLFDGALVDGTTAALTPSDIVEAHWAAERLQAAAQPPSEPPLAGPSSAEQSPVEKSPAEKIAVEPAAAAAPVEWLVIDAQVPDAAALAADARPGMQVLVLDPSQDGLSQIAQALAADGRAVSAMHVVSHGAPGYLVLGGTTLDAQQLEARAADLQAIGRSFTAEGDLMLYGCDVAATVGGVAFVDRLGQLTGADVAASSDATGGAAVAGNWLFEYATGTLDATPFLSAADGASYGARLATMNISGKDGWVPVMFGTGKDPQGDSQAGAADTDIIGDASHGSLYMSFSDSGTTSTADDYVYFRLRIDNPTSTTNFGGVAIVGMDANGDGKVDLFFSVDGRNNAQVVRLLDPGTDANISPNTTSTAPLPVGWLANNGIYRWWPGSTTRSSR